MQVKGTMVMDYVRIIRANPDKNWDRWLTPEDWEIIRGKVLPSQRYPYKTFRNIGFAVFKEIAGGDLNVARQFGRFTMKNWIEIYRTSILVPGDPVHSLQKLAKLRRNFFTIEVDTKVTEHGPDWARYQFLHYSEETDEERKLAYTYQMAGQLEEVVAQAGCQNPSTTISPIPAGYEILVKWTPPTNP